LDEKIGDMVKKTTRGGLILLVGQIVSTFILAFGMMFVARLLGAQQYGKFNAAQSVVQIAALIISLGIQPALVKYVAQFRHEKKYGHLKVLLEAGIMLSLITGISMSIIIYSLSDFIANNLYNAPEQAIYIKYLSLGLIGQSLIQISMGITTGYERMEMRTTVNFVYSIIKSIASPILVYVGLGTLGAVLGHALPQFTAGLFGLVLIVFLYRGIPRVDVEFSHHEAMKLLLSYGWPIYLSSLLGGSLPHLYTTLVARWADFALTGNYSAALNFGVLMSFVSIPIGTAIFPLFSKLDNSTDDLGFLYRNAVKYSTLFGYPVAFSIMALADQLVTIVFENSFPFAAYYLRLYMLAFTFIGIGSICNVPLLNSQKKTTTIFRTTVTRFIFAVPLSILLISRYHVTGLLTTILLMGGLNSILNYRAIRSFFDFSIDFTFLAKMLGISVISVVCVYSFVTYLSINQWIELVSGGILSLLIYLLGFIILRIFSVQDLNYLKKLGSGFGPMSPLVNSLAELLLRYA
jgi:O-antigen/teichoic acid export membrane protein